MQFPNGADKMIILWKKYSKFLTVTAILIVSLIFSFSLLHCFNQFAIITSAANEYAYISSFEINNVSIPITSIINVSMTYTLSYDELSSLGYAEIELFDPINKTVLVSKINYNTGTITWNETFYLAISKFKNFINRTIIVIGRVIIEGSSYLEDTTVKNFTITKARTQINIGNYTARVYYNSSLYLEGTLIDVDNLTYAMGNFQITLNISDINSTVLSLETITNEQGQFTFYLSNLSIVPKNYSMSLMFQGSSVFSQITNNVTLEVSSRVARLISSLSKTTSFASSISQNYSECINVNVTLIDTETNSSLIYYSLKILLNESVIYFSKNVSIDAFYEEILLPNTNGTYYLTLIAKKPNYTIENITYKLTILPRQLKYNSLELNYDENDTLYFGVSNLLKLTLYDSLTKEIIKNSTEAEVVIKILNIINKNTLDCTIVSSNLYSNGTIIVDFITPFNLYLAYLNNESMSKYMLKIMIKLNDSAYAPLIIFVNISNFQLKVDFFLDLQVNNLNIEKGDFLSLTLNVCIADSTNSTIFVSFFIDNEYALCENISTNTNFYLNVSLSTQNLSIDQHCLQILFYYNDREIKIVQLTFWIWLKTYINLKIYPAN